MNSRLNTKCLRNFNFFVLFPFKCDFEPRAQVNLKYIDSYDLECDEEDDEDFNEGNQLEEQELRGSCILETIQCDGHIAIFSSPTFSGLFYLCK